MRTWGALFLLAVLLTATGCHEKTPAPVRVAVIGGMTMSGLWSMVAEAFTARTGIPVELVATGPKDVLVGAFRSGGVDLLTMHTSDEATKLVADGLAVNMRPWAFNEHVILGPPQDPAGIRGMMQGAEALAKIAAGQFPFVEARNTGSQSVAQHLWKLVGLRPAGDWLLADRGVSSQGVVEFARERGAYVITGRIPVLSGKIPSGGMEILVQGDPEMRRLYVVVEAAPGVAGNPDGAGRLATFLLSPEGQAVLVRHGQAQADGRKLFFPLQAVRKP